MTYDLGGKQFRNKDQLRQHVRNLIASLPVGAVVNDPVITSLLSKHPQWEEKSKGMIRLVIGEIEVVHATTLCKTVVIQRPDGVMDITWSRLIDRLKKDGSLRQVSDRRENLSKIKVAARAAVEYQVRQVVRVQGQEIDHIYPRTFDRLLFLFLKWWAVPIESITIEDPAGEQVNMRFACWELETHWQLFHERLARLRAVPAAVNASAPIYPVDWSTLP